MKLLYATENASKICNMRYRLTGYDIEIITPKDIGIGEILWMLLQSVLQTGSISMTVHWKSWRSWLIHLIKSASAF